MSDPITLRSQVLAASLLQTWWAATQSDVGASTSAHERGLAALVEAAFPKWPQVGRANFIEVHRKTFRDLGTDDAVGAAIRERSYSEGNVVLVEQLRNQIAAEADSSLREAQAVIAGVVERSFGPEYRIAYIVDDLLAPMWNFDESSAEEVADDPDECFTNPEVDEEHDGAALAASGARLEPTWRATTPLEAALIRTLQNAAMIVMCMSGTIVLLTAPGVFGLLAEHGVYHYLLMTSVSGLGRGEELHRLLWSAGGMFAGWFGVRALRDRGALPTRR